MNNGIVSQSEVLVEGTTYRAENQISNKQRDSSISLIEDKNLHESPHKIEPDVEEPVIRDIPVRINGFYWPWHPQ